MRWRVACRKFTGQCSREPKPWKTVKINSTGQRERLKYDVVLTDILADLYREFWAGMILLNGLKCELKGLGFCNPSSTSYAFRLPLNKMITLGKAVFIC